MQSQIVRRENPAEEKGQMCAREARQQDYQGGCAHRIEGALGVGGEAGEFLLRMYFARIESDLFAGLYFPPLSSVLSNDFLIIERFMIVHNYDCCY